MNSINLLNNYLNDYLDNSEEIVVAAAKQKGIKTLCGIEGDEFEGLWQKGLDTMFLLCFDLEFNRALKSANLANMEIDDEDAIAISAALDSNTSLTKLDLSENLIYTAGAQAIAKMLMVNKELIKLSIGDNELGHGIQTICESLCHNDTLQAISFANKYDDDQFKMGAAGAKYVADMLKSNRALTSVNLLGNNLGDGAAAVVTAAKQNGTIKTLCGIESGQKEVELPWDCVSKQLEASDAALLSFDLEFNRSLKVTEKRKLGFLRTR